MVIVVDYKTSRKRLEWVQLYHGLDLQLPIYLLALQNAGSNGRIEEKSVGAFYLPIEVWPEGGDLDEPRTKRNSIARPGDSLTAASSVFWISRPPATIRTTVSM